MSIPRPTTNARPLRRAARCLSAAALALGLGVLLLAGPMAPSATAETATPAPALDSTFATLLNTLRATLGLGSLTVDPQLSDVARGWSTHMAVTQVMSHNPALTTEVPSWAKLGENVGTGGAVTQIFDALVASPPHMRNMSDPEFSRIGVATVTDSQGRLWTTHVFERPGSATAAPTPRVAAPAPVPAPARAPRPTPSPTTAAPVTAPPTTAAPVATTVPVPTTSAPPAVAAAEVASPTAAAQPENPPALTAAHPGSEPGTPLPLLAGAALLAVLVLGGAGFLVRRRCPPAGLRWGG